jgi:transcriptional regulator of arginine metabolism
MYIYALAARRQFPERPFALGIECGAMKLDRHNAIRQLVTTRVVTSQDELRRLLVKRGHEVTQATLSRDLHALRLFKGPGGYQIPAAPEANHDEDLPDIADILRNFGLRVRQAMNQLVVVTTQGSAQPVAAGIDDEGWPEVVGTIAGDNTVLIICPDTKSATTLKARLEELIG